MKSLIYLSIFFTLTSCTTNNEVISLVKIDGKFGFIDRQGNWYINPNFDSLGVFYNGYASACKNNKCGIIDFEGDLIIDYNFDFIGHFEEGIALIINNDSINYIDLNGHLILGIPLSDGEDFSCGLAPAKFTESGKWGYIDKTGKLSLDTIYDYVGEFKDCKASVDIGDFEFIISNSGAIIDTVDFAPSKRRFHLIGNSDSNTLGLINNIGDTIMPAKYRSFGYVQDNKFWFNDGSSYGLADTTGKILTTVKYEYLSYFADNGLALVKQNGKCGFINKDLVPIIDFQFQDADGFKYGLAAVKVNEKWGYINDNGRITIQPKFDKIVHQFRPVNAKFEPMYSYDRDN